MSADGIADEFEVIGTEEGTTDNVSSTGIGSETIPEPTERATYFPIGGGEPAPTPEGA